MTPDEWQARLLPSTGERWSIAWVDPTTGEEGVGLAILGSREAADKVAAGLNKQYRPRLHWGIRERDDA